MPRYRLQVRVGSAAPIDRYDVVRTTQTGDGQRARLAPSIVPHTRQRAAVNLQGNGWLVLVPRRYKNAISRAALKSRANRGELRGQSAQWPGRPIAVRYQSDR